MSDTKSTRAEPQPSSKALQPHIDAGHELIPVDRLSKKPSERNWTKTPPLSPEGARAHMARGGNVGVRLRDDMLVIDVDPRNFPAGANTFEALMRHVNVSASNWPIVNTGGGGWHYYLQ